jgi:FtsP/CotA-like multicopper oxidase with cupredoxin domain
MSYRLPAIALTLACLSPGAVFAAEPYKPLETFTAGGNRLDLKMTADTISALTTPPYAIGGYVVTNADRLQVCDKASRRCADAYQGALLHLEPGDTLGIDLVNTMTHSGAQSACMAMDAGDAGLLNLHTHGLLVPPYAHAAVPQPVFGDTVFHCVADQAAASGNVLAKQMRYEIAIPKSHPLGINWIHPHVHGLAKQQVSSGMTSMIEIGQAGQQLCRPTQGGGNACATIDPARVKHMLLKDAQLVPNDIAYAVQADEDADFCGPNKFDVVANQGECIGANGGYWVFTINNVKMPAWTIPADGYEIWRIQNASALVTYRLSLRARFPTVDTEQIARFQVLSMDGAGLAPSGTSGQATLPYATEVLLMPSSRIDLLVQAPAKNTRSADYVLVNEAYQAGSAPSDADIWPHIALATVNLQTNRATLTAMAEPPPLPTSPLLALSAPAPGKVDKALQANCAHLDSATQAQRDFYRAHLHVAEKSGWRRRVYFALLDPDFALGNTLVDPNGTEFDLLGNALASNSDVALDIFHLMGDKTDLCVAKNAGSEVWELVNVSAEVHNFHIHQLKFEPVRIADKILDMRAPSDDDRILIPDELLFKSGTLDLMHDVIVVPRGSSFPTADHPDHRGCLTSVEKSGDQLLLKRSDPANACTGTGAIGDLSGMIKVRIVFDGQQFKIGNDGAGNDRFAKFVYHCHILEHEDKGMMASITVIDLEAVH